MSYTQTDIANLKSALAKGASKVRVGDEEITFRSVAEIRQIIATAEAEIAGAAAPSRQVYPQFVRRPL